MKRISTILNSSLLVIIGTLLAQNSVNCQPTISTNPTSLTFSPTQTTGSYKLTMSSAGEYFLTITAPSGFQFSVPGDGGLFHTTRTFDMLPGNWTWTVNVQYTPTTSGANDSITNTLVLGSVTQHASVLVLGDPLPIQLASFKAETLTSSGVVLTWSTLSETNNYGFYVQRNGVDLTFVAGHGTTLQSHTYSYTDSPSPGQYQYRLKQVDLDGTATLSESTVIDVTAPMKFALIQNYPNPFNPSTQISFSITKEGTVSLRVYDVLGREVATLVTENRKAGQYTESFNGNQLASGVYVYVLRSSEGQLIGRMMLLK